MRAGASASSKRQWAKSEVKWKIQHNRFFSMPLILYFVVNVDSLKNCKLFVIKNKVWNCECCQRRVAICPAAATCIQRPQPSPLQSHLHLLLIAKEYVYWAPTPTLQIQKQKQKSKKKKTNAKEIIHTLIYYNKYMRHIKV